MGLCISRAPVLKNHPDSVFFWTDLTDLQFLFCCRSVDPLEVSKRKALLCKFRLFFGELYRNRKLKTKNHRFAVNYLVQLVGPTSWTS